MLKVHACSADCVRGNTARNRQEHAERYRKGQDHTKGARGSAARIGHVHTETDKSIQREHIARGSTARNGHVCAGKNGLVQKEIMSTSSDIRDHSIQGHLSKIENFLSATSAARCNQATLDQFWKK